MRARSRRFRGISSLHCGIPRSPDRPLSPRPCVLRVFITQQEARIPTHSTLWIKDAEGTYRPATADEVFGAHRKCLNQRFRRGRVIGSPDETRAYLVGQLAHEPAEIFAVLYPITGTGSSSSISTSPARSTVARYTARSSSEP